MMNESSTYCAQSLGEWLVLATYDLAAPAQRRIKLEIEAHFADAVAARMAEGLNQEDAEAAALSELGDPKGAAKSFRKRHLTEAEEKRLTVMYESWRKPDFSSFWWRVIIMSIGSILACLILCLTVSQESRGVFFVGGIYGLAMMVELIVLRHLVKKPGTKNEILRRSLAFDVVTDADTIIFWALMIFVAVGSFSLFFSMFLGVLGGGTFKIEKTIRLWLKLRYPEPTSSAA